MNANRGFDEVMIVNPSEPNGGRFMRFHYAQPPEMGYYMNRRRCMAGANPTCTVSTNLSATMLRILIWLKIRMVKSSLTAITPNPRDVWLG